MEADEYRQLDDDARGRYSGIGVEIGIQNQQARVVYVMDGGAAG